MKTDLTFLKPLVARVMCEPFVHNKWTVQGFGFLRTYFGPRDNPKRFRLNLWDSRFTVPNVSTIHDHPWDFKSVIIAGVFANQRYAIDGDSQTHHFTTIKTGEGGGPEKSGTHEVGLIPRPVELYGPRDVYHQSADEIHETLFKDGTVTINERVGDTEHARVFWPYGTDWVDAMPRPAERDEVISATGTSLGEWFNGY